MKNKKHKNYNDTKDLEYEMLGNLFIGSLLDMSGDLDNTAINLLTYLEVEEIRKLSKENK